MYKRVPIHKLTARLKEPRRFIQVLMGPRQVGKTTMVQQLLTDNPHYVFESADAVGTNSHWLEQVWETARLKTKLNKEKEGLLIIDEVQKIDNWSEIVKELWDEDTCQQLNLKVLLLGSSRLLMQQGLIESLAGRFENTYLGHWSFHDMLFNEIKMRPNHWGRVVESAIGAHLLNASLEYGYKLH